MVVNPHILLVGEIGYLEPLLLLLSNAGAKILNSDEILLQEDGKTPLLPAMTNLIECAYNSMGHIDTLLFCDRVRTDETECPDAGEIVRQTLDSVSRLLVSVRCLALKMIESESPGQIIIVCDTSAVAGRHNCLISSTVGGALIGMSKSLAKELGRYRIAVNIICLGVMEEIDPQNEYTPAEAMMLKVSGLGKIGSLKHLANNIMHLAGNEHWLNGQILHINDGLVM
ncbi:SDR family oxidoreductase [Methylicorpusculum oleiharenae]|uniref:SDR family oxidoreductase n=1 Tax=Methylicorpusculum oleiharenae TaxID=1338687 RepID=UPI001356B054|nr:SDR family oxidoreductase [Methylicorpusculum oleiharenae]MCD2451456.1 SDR family oxidoreductase [Methylicorpusculum oleiharenae]